jgi:WD40 repeat protein
MLISGGNDRFVRLWSVNTGQRIHARISENHFDDVVGGLQFSRKNDNGLWVAGQEVEYWSI